MKGGLAAVALAAMASGVAAAHHRHAHEALFKKHANETGATCTPTCTTIYHTYLGPPTMHPVGHKTSYGSMTTPTLSSQAPTSTPPVPNHGGPVPPPVRHVCPIPGDYTFPATTITIYQTSTYCPGGNAGKPTGTPTGTGTGAPIITPAPHGNGSVILPPGIYVAPEQIVHVTIKNYVFYCPFTRHDLPTSTSTSSSSTPPPSGFTPVPPPPPPPAKVQPAPPPPPPPAKVQPAPTPSPPPAKVQPAPPPPPPPAKVQPAPAPSSPAKVQPAPAPVSGGLRSDNDHFGITYTPFNPVTAACKSAEEVDSDIQIIKNGGFTTVRIYSPECNALQNVGAACKKYGVAMIVGVFVKASGCDVNTPDVKTQVDLLAAWDGWDLVKLVVVGNEAIMNGYCSPQQLRALIIDVKTVCGAKYKGPYTISETLNIWLRPDVSAAICPVIPVTGANIHAYFNPSIAPEMAGVFVKGQIDILSTICPGNEVINLECGYPSGGNANGLAVPGPSQQAIAIKAIRETSGHKTVFFDFQNSMWKFGSACACEDKFGVASVFDMVVSNN
ncbi:hypothetical protein E4U55_001154 [Claviceps digitariae]|nr:hypothetical protein E4U55_001154 [Claviceps digitariae]